MNIFVHIPQHATYFLLSEAEPRVFSSAAFLRQFLGETGLQGALPALLTAPAAAQGPRPCSNFISHRKRSPRGAAPHEDCPRGELCREVRPAPAGQPKACFHLTPGQPRRFPQARGGKAEGAGRAGARAQPQRRWPRRCLPPWRKQGAAHLVHLIRHLSNRLPRSPARFYGPSPSPPTGAGRGWWRHGGGCSGGRSLPAAGGAPWPGSAKRRPDRRLPARGAPGGWGRRGMSRRRKRRRRRTVRAGGREAMPGRAGQDAAPSPGLEASPGLWRFGGARGRRVSARF